MTRRERNRFLNCLRLALAVGIFMAVSYTYRLIPGLDQVQHLLNDATIFKTRPDTNKATHVALVHIDEKSIAALKDRYGRVFSWPRTLHAQVLRNLADARARVVAYDVLFDAPGCPATAAPPCQEDLDLAEAIDYARSRPAGGTQVILSIVGSPPEPQSRVPGEALGYRDSIPPLALLASRATSLAHIHPSPDGDGAVRRIPLVVTMKGQEVPALALEGAARYLRRPQSIERKEPGIVYFALRAVPTDSYYQALVNYQGRPSHLPQQFPNAPVPVVSFVDVLDNTFDRAVVRDKLVFLGLTAIGFADDYQVPTSHAGVKMSGVEIHAQAAEMLVRGAYLQEQGLVSTVVAILLLAAIPGIILARFQPVLAGAVSLAVLAAYFGVTVVYATLSEASLDRASAYTVLNSVYPGLAMLVSFMAIMLYRIVFEQAEQRATRSVMGKYLSPAVMDEVLKDPAGLKLGGQKREMTVLFSDIRGFTSVAERIDPSDLVAFLNEYLTEMTDIVFRHQGVLDKYMGDGIMAFWGAPAEQPDHAEKACRAGYEMLRRLRELQPGWSARGLPLLNIGVGINTGPMTAGNVGSKMRFDYTVMGDAVNLGSRLEGANKEYGTTIIVSDSTLQRVRHAFAVRFLDLIALRGKQKPTAIYELLAPLDEPAALPPPGFLSAWDAAMQLYKARRFDAARAAFLRALEVKPGDGPALAFIERCDAMASAPPGVEWDGAYAPVLSGAEEMAVK